jgi:DNA-binding SARP family transcriptional activator
VNTTEKTIRVRMLGGFTLWEEDRLVAPDKEKNGKVWNLLAYLIFHRHRVLNPGELPELLCRDEKIEDPANTVKNLVYRLRKQLQALGLDGSHCILQQGGSYGWNPAVPIRSDLEEFAQLYRKASRENLDREKSLNCYFRAAELYEGQLLPGLVYEEWTISHRVYYHRIFISCLREASSICRTPEERREMISLCEKAIAIDPVDEELYRIYIEQLLAQDRITDARSAYELIVNRLYRELGINPTQELRSLHRKILKRINSVEMDLKNIQMDLREDGSIQGCFCTDYDVFQDIYRFMSRNAVRKDQKVMLQLWTISCRDEEEERIPEKRAAAMERLMGAIHKALRRGDIFAQYSVSQFIIILPDITEENAEMVGKRILALYNNRKDQNGRCPEVCFKNQQLMT